MSQQSNHMPESLPEPDYDFVAACESDLFQTFRALPLDRKRIVFGDLIQEYRRERAWEAKPVVCDNVDVEF